MNIVDFGFFKVRPSPPDQQILFFENEDGQDWYELRRGLTEWDEKGTFVNAVFGTWAMVDADGLVTNVEHDPSKLAPGDRRVIGIDGVPKGFRIGFFYRDGELVEGPLEPWMEPIMKGTP